MKHKIKANLKSKEVILRRRCTKAVSKYVEISVTKLTSIPDQQSNVFVSPEINHFGETVIPASVVRVLFSNLK